MTTQHEAPVTIDEDAAAMRVGRMVNAAIRVSGEPEDMIGAALVLISVVADASPDRLTFLTNLATSFPTLPRIDWPVST